MHYLLAALLPLPVLVSAQELHTFRNGEVSDADKLNESLQYILNNASGGGGCSATQQDNSVFIECADGTFGVIAGAGAVLLIPEGVVGETPDYSAVNVGEFYWADGNGVFLGKRRGGLESSLNQNVYTDYCPSTSYCQQLDHFSIGLVMDHSAKQVFIDPYNSQVVYTQPDCEGPPLMQGSPRDVFMLDGGYAVWSSETLPSQTLLYSSKKTRFFDNYSGEWVEQGECVNLGEPSPGNGKFVIPYTPAPEILNAAYPVRLEQLP